MGHGSARIAVPLRAPSAPHSTVRKRIPMRDRLPRDADPASLEGDDVAELQLPSAAAIHLAVHGHVAVDDGLFHVSTGVEKSSELQELPEANDLTTDRDVVDRCRVRHSRMLAHQVPAAESVGQRMSASGSQTGEARSGRRVFPSGRAFSVVSREEGDAVA